MCYGVSDYVTCKIAGSISSTIGLVVLCGSLFYPVFATVQRGHSSITLYQGVSKFELDAKDCPVGVAFNEPERFSCACINGIWAFYDNPCSSPVAIVGGNNHCFRMPPEAISVIVIVSNPLRGLGDSLTVFEGDMNTIKAKFYRNVKLQMSQASGFVSLNSSWTLFSPDGSRSICLEKRDVVFEGLTTEEASAFPDLTYCSFVNVSKEMPYVGAVKKGCNSSMILEPTQCQPMLPRTEEEDVCLDDALIKSFQESIQKEIDPIAQNEIEEKRVFVTVGQPRLSRALENLGRFTPTRRRSVLASEVAAETTTPKYSSSYQGEPVWHQRMLVAEGGGNDVVGNETETIENASENTTTSMNIDLEDAWNTSKSFLSASGISNDSNQLVLNHLWMYYRYAIRNVLNITRLVPPDENMLVQIETGKVKKLLNAHIDIMKKICSLAPSSFFETVTGTFVGLLTKGFRWKEPYVEQTHYLRILASLTVCKNNAEVLNFVSAKPCSTQTTNYIIMPDTEGDGQVNVKLKIPDRFQSSLFEPIIEAVWKIFISVHSYCFGVFSDQYQDHHKYTTLMMGLFSNQIHDVWTRNKTVAVEYAGVLGNIANTMTEIEKCAVGARMKSEYPFHMSRPTKMFRYMDEHELLTEKSKSRPKRSSNTNKRDHQTNFVHIRKKRLAINAVNSETLLGNAVFGERGICLRKYGDSKNTVGRFCKKESSKRG